MTTLTTTDPNATPGTTPPVTPGATMDPPASTPPAASDGVVAPVGGGDSSTPGSSSPGVGGPPLANATNTLVSLGFKPELLEHERLKGINTVEDLANALVGANLAPPVVKPEEYQLPQGVPEDVRAVAHSLSLTQEQLNGVLNFQAQNFQAANESQLQQMAELGQNKLKEWGPQAQANLETSKRAVAYIESKSPGIVEMLNTTGYGNHPLVMELFKNVGELMKEGGFNKGEHYTPANVKNAADKMFPTQAKQN